MEFSVTALNTTNRLASGALGTRPLRLLITRRASIRTHGTIFAGITSDGRHDIVDKVAGVGDILNTRPSAEFEVVEGNSAVLGWEGRAVKFSIREVGIQTGRSGRAGSRAAGGGRGLDRL